MSADRHSSALEHSHRPTSNKEEMVRVVVTPGARREKIEDRGGVLALSVREKAEGNRANTRIKEVIAQRYGVLTSQVHLVTGARSRSKLIRISM